MSADTAEIDRLVKGLTAGGDPDLLFFSLIPRAEQTLLECCAFVRWFDEKLFNEVLRPFAGEGAEGIPFPGIAARSFLEQAPRGGGAFRVRAGLRTTRLRQWYREGGNSAGGTFADLSARLVTYFDGSSAPDSDLEALYHRLPVARDEAIRRFTEMYASADEAFDLARCSALLDVIADRPFLQDLELGTLVADHRAYREARMFWADEFYRTAQYQARAALHDRLEVLLAGGPAWIWHIHEKGGMGKTTFLRWLIARRCVPARIPCARIDFDFIGLTEAERSPARLLLQIAEQLDRQLPGGIFHEFIVNQRDLVLASEAGFGGRSTGGQLESFAVNLRESKGQSPVVIILDTLEEALLHITVDLPAFFSAIAALHKRYPQLILILSGRYDLRARVPWFTEMFGGTTEPVEVAAFTLSESERYLVGKRGITNPAAVLDEAIHKAEGVPFKLALLADLLATNPTIDAATIRAYPSADLLFLIERVVERIPDAGVRWMLRYGAVPRRLRRTFVVEVMKPFLVAALTGAPEGDDPGHGLERIVERSNAFPVGTVPLEDRIDPSAIWDELARYASDSSWVMPGGEADTLRFHGEVLNPMRALLGSQPIVGALHRAAINYYERKAKDDLALRGQWACEAIYHRFQLEGAEADTYWRAVVSSASGAVDPAFRLAIASELTDGSEYLDYDGAPRQRSDGTLMISRWTLAAAHWERAAARVELARSGGRDAAAMWSGAKAAIDLARKMETSALEIEGRQDFTAAARQAIHRQTLIEAPVLVHDGDPTGAVARLAALDVPVIDAERLAFELEYARALSALGSPEATRRYRAAFALSGGDSIESRGRVGVELGLEFLRSEQVAEAISILRALVEEARRGAAQGVVIDAAMALGAALLRDGRPAEAVIVLDVGPRTVEQGLRLDSVMARALLDLGRPVQGLKIVDRDLPDIEGDLDPDARWVLHAERAELRGLLLARLDDFGRAQAELDQARSLYRGARSLEGHARCWLEAVEISLRGTGNLLEAKSLLDSATRAGVVPGAEAWPRHQLLSAEVAYQSGNAETARTILVNLTRSYRLSPSLRSQAAVLGVVVDGEHAEQHWRELTTALSALPAGRARLRLIDAGLIAAPLAGVTPTVAALLAESTSDSSFEGLRAIDAGVTMLAASRLFALLGLPVEGAAALRSTLTLPGPGVDGDAFMGADASALAPPLGVAPWPAEPSIRGDSFAFVDASRAAQLLDVDPWRDERSTTGSSSHARHLELFQERYARYPLLCASALLDHALYLGRGDRGAVEPLLARAAEHLNDVSAPTRWLALLQELRAKAARGAGDDEKARGCLESAAGVYKGLGALRDASRIRSAQTTPIVDPAPTRSALTVQLDTDSTLLLLSRDGAIVGNEILPPGFLAARELSIDPSIGEIAGDWRQWATSVGGLLERAGVTLSAAMDEDLILDMPKPEAAALPWELASMPDGSPVARGFRHIYRSSPGFPRWQPFRREARAEDPGNGPPHVLVLQASYDRKIATHRSLEKGEGGEVGWVYSRCGFFPRMLNDPSPAQLERSSTGAFLGENRFGVVHIVAGFIESQSQGGTFLDFASDSRGDDDRAPSLFDVRALQRYLERFPRESSPPLVILDMPRSPSRTVLVRQLFLRNAFASELFSSGVTSAVLAAMLDGPLITTLATMLRSGRSIGDICRAIRAAEEPTTQKNVSVFATRATALFTNDPDLTLP